MLQMLWCHCVCIVVLHSHHDCKKNAILVTQQTFHLFNVFKLFSTSPFFEIWPNQIHEHSKQICWSNVPHDTWSFYAFFENVSCRVCLTDIKWRHLSRRIFITNIQLSLENSMIIKKPYLQWQQNGITPLHIFHILLRCIFNLDQI